ncbi:MAG TPA: outer membrane beta-barrel protein [Candidatus Acidoferrum sp.]|nr:outer membrane beta-barrel protein [Candidatus Acidoferrum sp.]
MKHDLRHRFVSSTRWPVAVCCGLAGVLPLVAQESNAYHFAAGIAYRGDADIENRGGEFNETRFGVTGSRTFNLNERVRIEPMLAYRFSAYDFSRPAPWDDIHTLRATVLGHYVINDSWSVFCGPSIGFAGESDADAEDAITFGGVLGVTYRVNDRLAVGAGFTASTEIEDDARVRPIVIVNWQITELWSIESGYIDVAGTGGPGGELRYKINGTWSVAGGVQFSEKRFRLSDDARVREGVGEDSSYPIYGKVSWQVCANAALELVGGVSVGGELLTEDRHGHKIAETDYDAAPMVGIRAAVNF